MTFLSQLPLLVFTLLNSFLYHRSVSPRGSGRAAGFWVSVLTPTACFRISEAIRVAGSLVFILLLFIFTAVLVKVDMEQDLFFSVTMATIWFINCKFLLLGGV